MSFHSVEISQQSGRPVYLLKFARAGKTWFYTNVEFEINFNGDTYLPAAIQIPDIPQSGTAEQESLRITLTRATDVVQYLDQYATSAKMSIFLRKVHLTEEQSTGRFSAPLAPTDAPLFWVGTISGVNRPSVTVRELVCAALNISRAGLRLTWMRGCPHMLYAQGPGNCNVDKNLFATPLTVVTAINGTTLTAAELTAQVSGWFSGGFIEWESEPGVVEQRGIEIHTGSVVTIFGGTYGIVDGSNHIAYAGCTRTPEICHSRFGNMPNYGGINHLQGRSPFDGNPVF